MMRMFECVEALLYTYALNLENAPMSFDIDEGLAKPGHLLYRLLWYIQNLNRHYIVKEIDIMGIELPIFRKEA
jgi:hypothetical protein